MPVRYKSEVLSKRLSAGSCKQCHSLQ